MKYLIILSIAQVAFCDVSHILQHHQDEITTPPPPPKPYAFGYAAGRFPGHIDRTHTEISDGQVVRGSYSYVDPHFRVRTVDYTADRAGFHPVLNTPQRPLPRDSPVVAAAKEKHLHLYDAIASSHQAAHIGVNANSALPKDSASVAYAKAKHQTLFEQIAAEHARIAAERALEAADTELEVEQELKAPYY